jgi:hypothetical protein
MTPDKFKVAVETQLALAAEGLPIITIKKPADVPRSPSPDL